MNDLPDAASEAFGLTDGVLEQDPAYDVLDVTFF